MDKNKLPVIKITRYCLRYLKDHYLDLLMIGLPFIVFSLLWQLSVPYLLDQSLEGRFYIVVFVGNVFYWLLMLVTVVRCHRLFLLDRRFDGDIGFFFWSGEDFRYLGWLIVVGMIFSLFTLPLVLINIFWISENPVFFNQYGWLKDLIWFAINIPACLVYARWLMVLPASAIGLRNLSIGWSWRLTGSNTLRLSLLVAIFPLLTSWLFGKLTGVDSIFSFLVRDIAWMGIAVFEVCLLSVSYRFLSEAYEESEDPSAQLSGSE